MSSTIRVAVSGAAGRMGREVVRAVCGTADMELVAAADTACVGQDAGELAGIGAVQVAIEDTLESALSAHRPDVVVDFTVPSSVMANVETALRVGVAPVVGTTGLSADDLARIRAWCIETGTPALVAPNFAIGAVLMMEFAARAARHMPDVEIIELHHERKMDAPSGTALMTARKIAGARGAPTPVAGGPAPSRGLEAEGIHLHSVRLPGLVAHQEVIFGGQGQTLTIRHDSIDRTSFMPGVLLAVRKVGGLAGLTVGLESLLFE